MDLNRTLTTSFMSKYLLDSNILITAYRRTYPMDIFPSFWENLLEQFENGNISLIDIVFEELILGEDSLRDWLLENESKITIHASDDLDVIEEYSSIIQNVMDEKQYYLAAKEEFADVADSWLIAHAKAKGCIIVTEETFQKAVKRRVKIPNECKRNGVGFITTTQLLRKLDMKM